jgi:hypothetical protein
MFKPFSGATLFDIYPMSPYDEGSQCAMQLCHTLFISQSRKQNATFKCNRVVRQTGLDSKKSAAIPIAPPLNSAEEFQ